MRNIKILLAIVLITVLVAGCGTIPSAPAGLSLYQDAGADPESWAFVPAGEYVKGQYNHEGHVENDFEIMVTEVTNAQYARYLKEAYTAGTITINENKEVFGYYPGDKFTGGKHEEEILAGDYIHMPLNDPASRISFDGTNFIVKAGYENHPVTMVSWFGALAYAEFYGYRLPTETEWEKAARGEDDRAFPWGEEVGHAYMNYYHSGDPFETAEGYSDTTPVGFYNGSTYGDFHTMDNSSPYGVYDMAGNVGEWTLDKHDGYHYRHIRGGSKASYEIDSRIWKENSATPIYVSPSTGFRVVRDPQ